MIYLNLLHRIFGRKAPLTRQEIDALREKREDFAAQQSEQDEGFNQDALEGWSTVDSNVDEQMSDLDDSILKKTKQMRNNPNGKSAYIFLSVFVATMIVLVIYTYQGKQMVQREKEELASGKTTEVSPDTSSTVQADEQETTNYQLTEQKVAEIDAYEHIDSNQQIRPRQLMNKERKTADKNTEPSAISEQSVDRLAPKNIDQVPTPETGSLTYKNSAEIYLNELKTVDYRSIREGKTISSSPTLPTGTPANRSEQSSDQIAHSTIEKQDIDYIIYLENSQYYFLHKQYKRALVRYLTILDHYPEDVNAHFYAGLCYYNLGQFEKALTHFHQSYSIQIGNFREEALWFEAQSFLQLNRTKTALKAFDRIKEEGGFYSDQAEKQIQEIKSTR
ncbi:MAG: tetratricopeptide repeat protein [Bacteroidota bacterium]